MYKIKGQKHENPQLHLGPLVGSHFILYLYKIDDYENCIYAPEVTKKYPSKDMFLTLQSMLNIHLNNPRTPKMVKVGLE